MSLVGAWALPPLQPGPLCCLPRCPSEHRPSSVDTFFVLCEIKPLILNSQISH